MTPNESCLSADGLRKKYLDFFKARGHAIIPSASLIPENDPTTLFTGSGMQPMIPYLMGANHPLGARIADSQKSFRAEDIEEVGDNRHTTFFEMLGNWSLGDPASPDGIGKTGYFKKEQISWMFEFLTKELGLPPSRIYVSVFRGEEKFGIPRDEDSPKIWQEEFLQVGIDAKIVDFSERDGHASGQASHAYRQAGMQDGRIFYYSSEKNWWSRSGAPKNMPIGEPGGPDSEMFWDFGTQHHFHENSAWKNEVCHLNCDCGRFVEIGNNVFMEYIRTEKGFEQLPQKNVDFGGGLERMLAAVDDNPDVFATELFAPIRKKIEAISKKQYGQDENETRAFRVVMDHLRAATMLMGDGAFPSNKDQGYFTRRLIRRAIRFADQLGIKENIGALIAEVVIDEVFSSAYPELKDKKENIISEMKREEERFRKTLHQGLKEFEKRFRTRGLISGEDAFVLYSTYGFPLELTEEIASDQGQVVDVLQFKKEFARHQELSRVGAAQKFAGGLADHSEISTKYHTATHLLNASLRKILGDHVFQKGSNITAERMRFDFSHPEKLTPEQIKNIENMVNEQIGKNLLVSWKEMSVEEAKTVGAIGVFGEKYGEKVKVYKVGDFSMEICGGPHVEYTGQIGKFKIIKEEAISAGARRIKAVIT